jgi:hypothetical protein
MPTASVIRTEIPYKDPKVANVSLPLKGVEVAHALPLGTRQYTIRARKGPKIQVALEAGKSGTEYVTVHGNYSEFSIDPGLAITLYVQSVVNGEVAEIITWK